ncbi:hypothetical protein GCM10025868_38540 [Angustibacter aerolatus]|uniref:Uncharacterized protein n=1 Tax=Angustibacter aerolatus TaxID=1162965 RepID=A0ABQ6JL55_9ACTN|nr:hypothetical protein GCM10025868_38540 [Angustibacter aerolatus]
MNPSGTRREEILLGREEPGGELEGAAGAHGARLAAGRRACCCRSLRETKSNTEFLMQVQKTTPLTGGRSGSDED